MGRKKIKDERIHIKTTHEIKEAAQAAAEADNRTLSSYIETLILEDTKKKKIGNFQ